MSDEKAFQERIAQLAVEQAKVISANREKYVSAWIAETGLAPSESMLVEQRHADGRVTITIERRKP